MHEAFAHFAAAPVVAVLSLLIVFAGAVVQFGLGMGFGLTVAPVLAVLDPALVPVPALVMSFFVSITGALRERRTIIWREALTAGGGRLSGTLVATIILVGIASPDGFSLIFGLLILLAVALSLSGLQLAFRLRNIYAMGLLSGLMATITSVGAPPLAIVYQGRAPKLARPTLAATFSMGTVFALAGLIASGWADWLDLWYAILLSPAAVAGFFAARALGPRFDARYRMFLLGISGISGVILVLRGLT